MHCLYLSCERFNRVEEAQVDVKYHLINLLTVDVMGGKLFTVDEMAQKGTEI